ncbi:MAG: cysteine synthase A [Oscillospiraceae bacterium]|nr:cysteine synthase A [Oscillospiraceae bacterium]
MGIYHSVEELIGSTPLVELCRVEEKFGLKAKLLVKLESFNPGGSAKDRAAVSMLDDAEAKGLIDKNSVIIEPTSGNTGIGLACVGTSRGYKVIIVMPDSMSMERRMLMSAYGAELVLTPGSEGMSGAISEAQKLSASMPGSFIPSQFTNPANSNAHYLSTGPEIWRDTEGNVDIFVAGVGTGGTLSGVGRYLKERKADVRIVAVEPSSSPLLSRGKSGAHGLQGIGANFVPEILDLDIIDEIICISDDEAYSAGAMLGRTEGILAGISSGAALHAAIKLASLSENEGKTVVALLPDTGERYLSTKMFSGEF